MDYWAPNVNENAATARGLLIALRALGSVNRAEAFETAFERVNWDLDKQHIVELNAAIAEAEGVSVEAVQRPKSPARTDDLPDCLKLFEPFVIPIEGNRDILAALNELGRPGVGGHRVQAVRDLFTEVLGFEARNLDVRERLGSQKTITALLLIAEFDEFVVTVAHVDKVLPYSNVYQPVFRLFPYGLCVVLDTSGRIVRFVYSHGRDGDGARSISYRAFAGPAPGRSVNDNIVVWLKRFDLIRPAFGDDRSKVRDRVEAALSATPGDLAMRWPSGGLDPTQDLPGAQWGELPRVEADSFVQLHADDRIHWGLEAVLRDRFPMFGARKRAVLRYEGHHVDGGADEFHYRVTLKLRLEPASPADTTVSSSSLEVVCVIPKPDVHGRFVIEGCAIDVPFNDTPAERRGKALRCALLCTPDRSPFNDTPAERRGKVPDGNLGVKVPDPFNDTPAERRGKGAHAGCAGGVDIPLQRHPGRTPGERGPFGEPYHTCVWSPFCERFTFGLWAVWSSRYVLLFFAHSELILYEKSENERSAEQPPAPQRSHGASSPNPTPTPAPRTRGPRTRS